MKLFTRRNTLKSLFAMATLAFSLSHQNTSFAAAKSGLEDVKARKELRVGLDPGFIPFEMKKPNGEWVGFDVDMITAFANELGVKPVFFDTKWEGIIPALQAKKFDVIVSGMTITEERSKVVQFSDPYYRAGLAVLMVKKHEGKVKSAADLNSPQYTIAVKLGTTADFYVGKNLQKAKIVKLDSESDSANSVLLGKVDAFVYDKPYVALFARKNKDKVSAILEPITVEDFGVAGRKKDKDLMMAFNAFLKKWKETGEYDKAMKRHFEEMPWLKDFPELK